MKWTLLKWAVNCEWTEHSKSHQVKHAAINEWAIKVQLFCAWFVCMCPLILSVLDPVPIHLSNGMTISAFIVIPNPEKPVGPSDQIHWIPLYKLQMRGKWVLRNATSWSPPYRPLVFWAVTTPLGRGWGRTPHTWAFDLSLMFVVERLTEWPPTPSQLSSRHKLSNTSLLLFAFTTALIIHRLDR